MRFATWNIKHYEHNQETPEELNHNEIDINALKETERKRKTTYYTPNT